VGVNASIQIKTHSVSSAANKNTHILRNSEAYENPNIIILAQPQNRFSKPTKEKPKRAVLKNEEERKKELNRVNAAISVYTKRIEAIIPDDEGKRKRIQRLEQKRRELLKKREELKQQKQVEEARGRKQEHYYVEFIFSITDSSEYRNNDEFVDAFIELQNRFLNIKFCEDLEIWTNAIHLDQFSVHSHVMFKIPEGQTWKKHLQKFEKKDGRVVYKALGKHWHNLAKNKLSEQFGIELENQTSGKRYISLRNYKKQNPVQILEKEEKINSRPDMSGISPSLRSLLERAIETNEKVNSHLNSKSTQSESSNSQQDTEAQPSSSPSPKPQKRARR
jgi:hypothetical protein